MPTPPTSSRDSLILRCSILGMCALMSYYLGYISLRVSHAHFGDFPTFYNAGWAVRSHTDPYAPGDDRVLDITMNRDASPKVVKNVVSEIERMGGQAYFSTEKHNAVVAIEGGGKLDKERIGSLAGVEKVTPDGMSYVYPPLFSVLCEPLTFLRATGAAEIFLLVNVACVLASLLIGSREMMRRLGVPLTASAICAVALFAGLLAENDLRGELQAMETDVLILLMFTLALRWLDDKPLRGGAALAFAMNIKYLTILALPYLLLRRRWKAAGAMVTWTVGFGLLPALVLGWNENLRCLRTALGGLLGWVGKSSKAGAAARVHGIADGLSISVTSAFARALRMYQLPQSYSLPIAAALGLVLLAGAWLLYRGSHFPMWRWPDAQAQQSSPFRGLVALEWAALIIVTLAFSPDTNTRHLSMVALVYTCAAPMLLVRRENVPWWPLLLGTIIAFFGLIMPVKSWVSVPVLKFYFMWSFCSWSLLVMYALLLVTGLRYVAKHGHLR